MLLWRRTTGPGVLAGMLSGFSTAVIWREYLHQVMYELAPAIVVSFAAATIVSLLTARPSFPTAVPKRSENNVREYQKQLFSDPLGCLGI